MSYFNMNICYKIYKGVIYMLNDILDTLKTIQEKLSEEINQIDTLKKENEELKANDKSAEVAELQAKVIEYESFIQQLQSQVDELKKLLGIL